MASDHIPNPGEHVETSESESCVIYIRLPRALVARVDEHASDLSRRAEGADVSRAAAIRALISRALDGERAA